MAKRPIGSASLQSQNGELGVSLCLFLVAEAEAMAPPEPLTREPKPHIQVKRIILASGRQGGEELFKEPCTSEFEALSSINAA